MFNVIRFYVNVRSHLLEHRYSFKWPLNVKLKVRSIGTKFIPALKYGAFFGFSRKKVKMKFFYCTFLKTFRLRFILLFRRLGLGKQSSQSRYFFIIVCACPKFSGIQSSMPLYFVWSTSRWWFRVASSQNHRFVRGYIDTLHVKHTRVDPHTPHDPFAIKNTVRFFVYEP